MNKHLANKIKSKEHTRVEHVFGHMANSMELYWL